MEKVKFINGKGEIHWQNEKLSHFQMLKNLLEDDAFVEIIKSTISRVVSSFNEQAFKDLLDTIDDGLPNYCEAAKIPDDRKRLIYKLVLSRVNILKGLI